MTATLSANERDLKKTALSVREAVRGTLHKSQKSDENEEKERLATVVEARLVSAAWTLRRLPDRERGFLHMRGTLWPDTMAEAGSYPETSMSSLAARRQVRISAQEIDQMQPTLDLLTLLPDVFDRQILFWTAWHQDGECQTRIPWAKVRRSLGTTASRWTLRRRYEAGLKWLAALISLQQ